MSLAAPPKVTEPERPTPPTSPTPEPKTRQPAVPATGDRITALREQLGTRRQPFAALLEPAKLRFADGRLTIQPPSGDTLLEQALDRKNNAALLEELVREIWGDGTTWVVRPPVESGASDPESPSPREVAMKDASEDPTVRAVLDVFGGRIQNVTTP